MQIRRSTTELCPLDTVLIQNKIWHVCTGILIRKTALPMARELTEQERTAYLTLASKLKMQHIPGVVSAGLTRRTERFTMQEPVVYTVPGTETFVVFGNLGYGYDIRQLRDHLLKLRAGEKNADVPEEPVEKSAEEEKVADASEEAGSAPETAPAECNEEDIDLLVSQTGASREEAKKALRKSDNDVLGALGRLTE